MENAASATLAPALAASTVKAAALVAAGKGAVAGLTSANVGALVNGGLKAMMIAKLKVAAAVLVMVGVAGAGGGVAYNALQPQDTPTTPAASSNEKDVAPEIPAARFKELHALVKPKPEEFAWLWEIPWEIDIQTARERAAREDKPILILSAASDSNLGIG